MPYEKKKKAEINSDTHQLIRAKQQSAALLLSREGCCGGSHMRDFNSSGGDQFTFHSSRPPALNITTLLLVRLSQQKYCSAQLTSV